jgi:hypothetical protein
VYFALKFFNLLVQLNFGFLPLIIKKYQIKDLKEYLKGVIEIK